MKKKLISLALISALILSLAACGAPAAEVTPTPAPTVSGEPEASPTPEPSAEPEEFDGTILVASEFDGLASTYEDDVALIGCLLYTSSAAHFQGFGGEI